jgi:hypothetical protein
MICYNFKEISTDELIEHVLELHERSKIEIKKHQQLYWRMQITEGLKELLERDVDIVRVFHDSGVLDRYKQ